jgi:DNA polymerase-3 subunit epsilon
MFKEAIVCVDTETTGLLPHRDRVIEIGLVRVEHGREVDRFHTLLDPEVPLPSVITDITGLTDRDLKGAPKFADVSSTLADLLDGALFVAHNADFDLRFIQHEFAREGVEFAPERLCTVKLSRTLFPHERRHNLAALIERYGFNAEKRHRAFDDALVVWNFLEHVQANVPEGELRRTVGMLRQR